MVGYQTTIGPAFSASPEPWLPYGNANSSMVMMKWSTRDSTVVRYATYFDAWPINRLPAV